ncbi:MAG: hypothetical protein J6Q12_04185 [Bacteroidales bacterium]|nr:hypothetical protein [Bacteroidales bacterium]
MKKPVLALLSCCFAFSSCDLIEVVVDELKDLTNNELVTEPQVSVDGQFTSEADVINALDTASNSLSEYIIKQMEVEKILFNKDFNSITPDNPDIADLWAKGYRTINIAINSVNSLQTSGEFLDEEAQRKYEAKFNAISGFIYKNMFEHWGSVPIITSSHTVPEEVYRPEESEILEHIYAQLKSSADILMMEEHYDNSSLSYPSILLALSEIKHWDYNVGLEYSRRFKETTDIGNPVFFVRDENGVNYTIYTRKHADLLEMEYTYLLGMHNDEINSIEDIVRRWDSTSYGYWAMLKRLGRTAEVIGCPEYMELLPVPENELYLVPNLVQNPGY